MFNKPERGNGAFGGRTRGTSLGFLHLHFWWQGEQYEKNDGVHGEQEHGGHGGQLGCFLFFWQTEDIIPGIANIAGDDPGIAIGKGIGMGRAIAISSFLELSVITVAVVVVVVASSSDTIAKPICICMFSGGNGGKSETIDCGDSIIEDDAIIIDDGAGIIGDGPGNIGIIGGGPNIENIGN